MLYFSILALLIHKWFLSVVVITCPSHGQGRRFDPGRKHGVLLFLFALGLPPLGCGRCQGQPLMSCKSNMVQLTLSGRRLARWSRGMILA